MHGRDKYPKTIQDTYELLLNTQNDSGARRRNFQRGRGGRNERGNGAAVSFAQKRDEEKGEKEPMPGSDGITHKGIRCYRCQKPGHYADKCTKTELVGRRGRTGTMGVQCAMTGSVNFNRDGEVEHVCLEHQGESVVVAKNWVLLDTCFTDSCTNDANLLLHLPKCEPEEELTLNTNRGPISFFKVGTMRMIPVTMYFN